MSSVRRLSPSAVAALVVAGVGATRSVARIRTPFGFFSDARVIAEIAGSVFVPLSAGVVALWLCVQARNEIQAAGGALIGAGWVQAARVLAIVAITVCVVSTVAALLLLEVVDEGVVRFVR